MTDRADTFCARHGEPLVAVAHPAQAVCVTDGAGRAVPGTRAETPERRMVCPICPGGLAQLMEHGPADKSTWLTVTVWPAPDLPGQWLARHVERDLVTQGDSPTHALRMMAEAIELCAADASAVAAPAAGVGPGLHILDIDLGRKHMPGTFPLFLQPGGFLAEGVDCAAPGELPGFVTIRPLHLFGTAPIECCQIAAGYLRQLVKPLSRPALAMCRIADPHFIPKANLDDARC